MLELDDLANPGNLRQRMCRRGTMVGPCQPIWLAQGAWLAAAHVESAEGIESGLACQTRGGTLRGGNRPEANEKEKEKKRKRKRKGKEKAASSLTATTAAVQLPRRTRRTTKRTSKLRTVLRTPYSVQVGTMHNASLHSARP